MLSVKYVVNLKGATIKMDLAKKRSIFVSYQNNEFECKEHNFRLYFYDMNAVPKNKDSRKKHLNLVQTVIKTLKNMLTEM